MLLFPCLTFGVQVTHVSAPNFAYEFCIRKVTSEQMQSLRLDHLKVTTSCSPLAYFVTKHIHVLNSL